MNYRIPLAGLLAAVAMFVWTAIAHMSPLGMIGMQGIPGEAAPAAALQTAIGDKPGLYTFPWTEGGDMKAYEAKTKSIASGFLVYHPVGQAATMTAMTLVLEFLKQLVCCLAAAFLLAEAADSIVRFAVRAAFVGVVGVVASINTTVSQVIWYGFPGSYAAAQVAIDWIGYIIAGLVLAAMIKPSTNPKPPIT